MFELVIKAVPVQRGPLDKQISYVASITFGDIARLLNDGHLYIPNTPELADFAQRKLNQTRVKAISRYILDTYQDGTTFFPAICVNVQPAPTYKKGNLYLPYHSMSLRLTDGQHRCYGIRQALQDIQDQKSEYALILSHLEISVLIYAALILEEERQAFRDQNLLVQRPSVSLAHAFDKRSPTTLIAKELLKQVPHFRNNVEMVDSSLGKHNPKLVTLATLVSATQYMFPHLKSKENLEPFVDWATTFWTAVASVLPQEVWKIKSKEERAIQRQNSITVSAVLFQALGMLANDLYQENVPADNLIQWITKLKKIDWHRNHQLWQERGVTQIGVQETPTISNTKTTISNCHRILREIVGVTPVSGIV